MPNHYYVRDNGVFVGAATGDAGRSATARTGAWDASTANSYNSLLDLLTVPSTPPANDDIIHVASDHDKTYASTTSININASAITLKYISTDITDQESYLKGGTESVTSGTFQVLANTIGSWTDVFGVSFFALSGVISGFPRLGAAALHDLTFSASGTMSFNRPQTMYFNNCDVFCASFFGNTSGCEWHFNGGSITTTDANKIFNGSGCVFINDVDLSGCPTGVGVVDTTSLTIKSCVTLVNCKIPTGLVPQKTSSVNNLQYIVEWFGCDQGNGYFRSLYFNRNEGIVSTNTDTFLNYSYDDTSKASYLIESLNYCGRAGHLRYKLCEIPAQDLSLTDTTYRINLLLDTDTVSTLNDLEFWVDVSHSNNTDLALGNLATSKNSNMLSAGVVLTSSSETWLGTLPTNTTAYQVDVTLSAAALANVDNSNVIVYVNLAVPDADVYVDPSVQIGP